MTASPSTIRESDPTPDKGTNKFINGIFAQLSERESDTEDCNHGCGASNHPIPEGEFKVVGPWAQFYSTRVPNQKRVAPSRGLMTTVDGTQVASVASFTNTDVSLVASSWPG